MKNNEGLEVAKKEQQKKITISKSRIIRELKLKEDSGRRNITFSIDEGVIDRFKAECKNNGLTMNKVVEKLMIEFIG